MITLIEVGLRIFSHDQLKLSSSTCEREEKWVALSMAETIFVIPDEEDITEEGFGYILFKTQVLYDFNSLFQSDDEI